MREHVSINQTTAPSTMISSKRIPSDAQMKKRSKQIEESGFKWQANISENFKKRSRDHTRGQFSMANKSVIFMFVGLALLILVISLAECIKRTQYHEQVSSTD